MSEGDVSTIRDEDQLRRMWQQTEDFTRKKEIRAHMYRLREERLRNLYSPEPTIDGKGCEFSSAQGHVHSFADQTFQSMKSKEVRDAGSPPKEFTYRGQDLKELSNAGWNVESENKTTDDGHTHVRSVQANIEGKYDVDGGRGQFAAIDSHKQAVTEYQDENTNLKRNESATNTAAHEEVVRKTDDGTQFSSKTSSSTSASKFQQVSSSKIETVPYSVRDVNVNEQSRHVEDTSKHISNTEYQESLRSNVIRQEGELVSRRVDYPDESTKVVTETRCLADGTRVTSTHREFRSPVVESSHSEQRSHQSRSESRYSSTEANSEVKQSSVTKVTREANEERRERVRDSQTKDSDEHYASSKNVEPSYKNREQTENKQNLEHHFDESRRSESVSRDSRQMQDIKETKIVSENHAKSEEYFKEKNVEDNLVKKTNYETTYQSDYTQKKISTDHSPTHQAWASTLRADTPTTGRPSTRGSSPSSRTYMSSTSSLRSSVSPDKTYRRPSSRGGSPNKYEHQSPVKSTGRYSSTSSSINETNTSRYTSSEKKTQGNQRPRASASPEKRPNEYRCNDSPQRFSSDEKPSSAFDAPIADYPSETKKPSPRLSPSPQRNYPTATPAAGLPSDYRRPSPSRTYSRESTPTRASQSPGRKPGYGKPPTPDTLRSSASPDRKPHYMKPTAASQSRDSFDSPRVSPTRPHSSPDRKSTNIEKTEEDHYKFIDEETKMYTHTRKIDHETRGVSPSSLPPREKSASPASKSPKKVLDEPTIRPLTPTLKDSRRSPSPPKGPVKFIDEVDKRTEITEKSNETESKKEITTFDEYIEEFNKKTSQNQIISQDKQDFNKTRMSQSPVNTKHKYTSDFISTELKSEELNKNSKNHPRQLVTPSSSPTRKPKLPESVTSTGQSSPTESVSDIVYFNSPCNSTSTTTKTIVMDLDDQCSSKSNVTTDISSTFTKRPESLNVARSPSPTKIPCRSPSPQKSSPIKDSFPRKSSLKKPSKDSLLSPVEKPPTNFTVSPTIEKNDFSEHKVVKKDRPEKSDEKVKPPFERRETYEERCRKILGMMDDEETKKKEEEIKTTTNISKVSPSRSLASRESSPHKVTDFKHTIEVNTKTEVNDYIDHETEDNIKSHHIYTTVSKSKTPSRESSPTKTLEGLQKTLVTKQENNKSTGQMTNTRNTVSPTHKIPEASKLRTPSSPTKNVEKVIAENTEFIMTEREQEVLDKVQKSLRMISPNRENRSPSREKSPCKTASLQDLNIKTSDTTTTKQTTISENSEVNIKSKKSELPQMKAKDESPKSTNKFPSRNASPTKKSSTTVTKSTDFSTKSRSMSPRKPVSPSERPESPKVTKTITNQKSKEPVVSGYLRKSTPVPSPTKSEKSIIEDKKTYNITKQNSLTKITTTKIANNKSNTVNKTNIPDLPKGNKENYSPRKDSDAKINRTASDISIRTKKSSPQRIKSKPEIHVHDVSSKAIKNTTNVKLDLLKIQKPGTKESQQNYSIKPKSATALNTQLDDNEVLFDFEQAKSSRENSPDRICPTPVNFSEEVGTPRLPDEVSEPDDDFQKRTHHTIHESESIGDDIVEISEDEEVFTKQTDINRVTASDECLLSVNDKVSKFTNEIEKVVKPKESTAYFKNTERKLHSDFVDENLKSDECLLSVSEKVSKFAHGPSDADDKPTPRRSNISEEFEKDTKYQDDHTKLSVNDKAHYFVETADNINTAKSKPAQKVERPDINNVDESLRSDDCLLSVSDKVNKFIKTAELFLNESQEEEEKDRKIRQQREEILKAVKNMEKSDSIVETKRKSSDVVDKDTNEHKRDKLGSFTKKTTSSHAKSVEYSSPNLKPVDKTPIVKITTLRSSEAVKKAKALFENIASTTVTKNSNETKTTKLTDIGVIKKSPKTDSTTVLHPSIEDFTKSGDIENDIDIPTVTNGHSRPSSINLSKPQLARPHEPKSRDSPAPLNQVSTEVPKTKTTARQTTDIVTKSVLSRYPVGQKAESPLKVRPEPDKPQEKIPSHPITIKTTQPIEEKTEDVEVSTRRGSGKFGVELKRTSVERSTISSERRRSSTEHHQPCIEDIYDLDLLEQMLEKVVGYEQRRRIRSQIRVAKKKIETGQVFDSSTYTKSIKSTMSKSRSPDRSKLKDQSKPVLNGHVKEITISASEKHQRPPSPEKSRAAIKNRSPTRQQSPDKKTRNLSPTKSSPKPKVNRFSEYASAYMKKVGLNDADKKSETVEKNIVNNQEERRKSDVKENITEERKKSVEINEQRTSSVISKSFIEKTSSKDLIEIEQQNGKRQHSPQRKAPSPEKKQTPNERLYYRSPSPDFRKPRYDAIKQTKETIIKTVYENDKKIPQKQVHEEKPAWVTNRNLKKTTSETRTFSSKKIESDKQKYRSTSPSKVISKPIDVITSSYGPGPLDADGRPLFGIKALRNGASNYQVRGTVVREEYHSRNGSAPEGTVSVTAYSTEPEELEKLLRSQGEPISRLHGLAAITTTKKFGGNTGTSIKEVHSKEERASLDQFTHNDRKHETRIEDVTEKYTDNRRDERKQREKIEEIRIEDRRSKERVEDRSSSERVEEKIERKEDKKTVRQSSIKSLTEKYIKNASDTKTKERGGYPKAGLILRTGNSSSSLKDGLTNDAATEKYHIEEIHHPDGETVVETKTSSSLEKTDHGYRQTVSSSKTSRSSHQTSSQVKGSTLNQVEKGEKSFLDSNTKVTGVQDILKRMKNADIVIEDGDTTEDSEARALLNKFLGATVLMAGMQNYVVDQPGGPRGKTEQIRSKTAASSTRQQETSSVDLEQCWDERVLRQLLEESSDYEQRRRIRARLRSLMAEQEACATAVTEALAAAEASEAQSGAEPGEAASREEEEVTTVTSSVRRNSSEKTVSSSTTSSKVIESMTKPAPKPASPFAKFRQLEKQNSTNSPSSPKTPQSPGSPGQPYFKFTDPALQASAATIKERLLQWCRDKTRDYENVKLENFSTSWADGLAFCALVHHFLPDAFDYTTLTSQKRRDRFTLAFKIADEKAGIYPLLDVDDMVNMRKPDWKCVFTYVQSIHRRFKDQD